MSANVKIYHGNQIGGCVTVITYTPEISPVPARPEPEKQDWELRVSGREGGTHTQRRYGSIYTLKLDHRTRTYWYCNFAPKRSFVFSIF